MNSKTINVEASKTILPRRLLSTGLFTIDLNHDRNGIASPCHAGGDHCGRAIYGSSVCPVVLHVSFDYRARKPSWIFHGRGISSTLTYANQCQSAAFSVLYVSECTARKKTLFQSTSRISFVVPLVYAFRVTNELFMVSRKRFPEMKGRPPRQLI